MNFHGAPAFTIGRKLGLVFLLLVALLGLVCLVVVLQLRAMQHDAERVFEESEEEGYSQRLLSELETLEVELEDMREHHGGRSAEAQAQAERVKERVAAVLETARRFEEGPEDRADPSRDEHQQEELRIVYALRDELLRVQLEVMQEPHAELLRHVERARRFARVLYEEMREEAGEADRDLLERRRTATWIMIGTLIAITAALLFVLWLVRFVIVAPLRTLQRRAEALGRGEKLPPGRIHNRDEIGALARSFAEMAERVSATREDLEERVATRTRELLRAARYADVGVLAAGVAHEVNNPLASIASCAEGLQRRRKRGPVPQEEEAEYLDTIASQAYRAREVTARLLALSRQDAQVFRHVGLGEVCEQAAKWTRHQLQQSGVHLQLDVATDLPPVLGDALELVQMLVNLILNARDASPAGGTVRLLCGASGSRATLAVEDEGSGIPSGVEERIFEPFFTTKRPGLGTGLGLALVKAIAKGHGGEVRVERGPAGGARFVVELPFVDRIEMEHP
ncbi:MAG: HAMP domain-containing protein [Planctomycetes bacterium]|nr:HAMP domain-containing protein [Planctomycetota bacterium]